MKKMWAWLFKDGHGIWLVLAIVAYCIRVKLEYFHQLTIWLNIGSFAAFTLFYILYLLFGVHHRLTAIKNIKWGWMIAASVFLFVFVWVFPWGDVTVPPSKTDIATYIGAVGLFYSLISFGFAFMDYAYPKKMKGDKDEEVDMIGMGL